jgi:Putative peptidoglycan binding domain/L,D-transpeptidase catalytic domain
MVKNIRVELANFRVIAQENGNAVKQINEASFGKMTHKTPQISDGALHPTKRNRNHRSNRYPPPNGGAPMNFALFFRERPACAFHEGSTRVPSHGCIHLERDDARWLFEWAGTDPVGLDIIGPYPARPVPPNIVPGEPTLTPELVLAIQNALENKGFDVGDVDGVFGPLTEDAVMDFQRSRELVADGIVGPVTAEALGIQLA